MKKKITVIFIILIILVVILFIGSDNKLKTFFTKETNNDGMLPDHDPLGTGVGIFEGRVSWVHNPASVNWNGSNYWWEETNFNEEIIKDMIDKLIMNTGGKNSVSESYDEIFKYFNKTHNKGDIGYKDNEKIAIKANINGSAVFDDDTSGKTNMSYTNPVLLKMLLKSLVEDAKINPQNIIVYDVSRLFPKYMIEMCTEGNLKGINFIDRNSGIKDENNPINWSYPINGKISYIPTVVIESDYLINLANLKGHSYGVTLTAKNHFGSFINSNKMRPPEGASLHSFLTKNEMNTYSPLTDLTANKEYGGKTLLYILDALICAVSEGTNITRENSTWQMSPFNNYYTSSIFMSLDTI